MDRTERFYRIDQLLKERRAVSLAELMKALEVSRATVRRDLEYLRDRLNAPIVWDPKLGGYRYESQGDQEPRYALPGLWFSASEVHALLTMDHLLAGVQPRLLEPHIAPLRARVRSLLDAGDYAPEAIQARIRIVNVWTRPVEPRHFEVVASATVDRRRLVLTHFHRKRNETLRRQVSPQRLVHYRGNWYLDAWCHLRDGLRSFALDAMEAVQALPESAQDVEPEALTTFFDAGYGVFSGPETKTAVLRFTPTRARWVAQEVWHPRQQSAWDEVGGYVLRVPYADETELLMDILRHGADVEVLAPEGLREHVRGALEAALARYGEAEAGLTG